MKEKHVAIEDELNQIMFELGMDPFDEIRSFRWLKELILLSVYSPFLSQCFCYNIHVINSPRDLKQEYL